jgi:adenylate kinase family enzyme
VGLAGAGKTWFGQQLAEEHFAVINTEKHHEVGEKALALKRKLAKSKKHVYVDDVHAFEWDRHAIQNAATRENCQVVVIHFDLPEDVRRAHCLERVRRQEPHRYINTEEDVQFTFEHAQHPIMIDARTLITVKTVAQVVELAKHFNARTI